MLYKIYFIILYIDFYCIYLFNNLIIIYCKLQLLYNNYNYYYYPSPFTCMNLRICLCLKNTHH